MIDDDDDANDSKINGNNSYYQNSQSHQIQSENVKYKVSTAWLLFSKRHIERMVSLDFGEKVTHTHTRMHPMEFIHYSLFAISMAIREVNKK